MSDIDTKEARSRAKAIDMANGRATETSKIINGLCNTIDRLEGELAEARELNEQAWVVIANVSSGDWSKQHADWLTAAERVRDKYFTPPAAGESEKA